MGVETTQIAAEKGTDSRGPGSIHAQTAVASPTLAYELHADHVFGSGPAEPPSSTAKALSVPSLTAPVVQRVQRSSGNRSVQKLVMRSRVVQRHCACGGKCAECQKKNADEEEQRLVQRRSANENQAASGTIPPSAGQPIDGTTRESLEAHFQWDLSDVRIHTDSAAQDSANGM